MNATTAKAGSGIAMIGGGLVASLHALGIRASSGARLAAISSRSAARAGHMGMLLGAPHFTFAAHDAMFARSDVDMVIVGSPNGAHSDHARAALAAGKAIVVEKPLTLTLADAADLVARARDGAFIGYAENHVFAPVVQELRHRIDTGAVGSVRRIEGRLHNPALAADGWHGSAALSGGGALVDLGSHLVATSEWLLGDDRIKEVSRTRIERDARTGLDRRADVVMQSGNGVEIVLSVGFGVDPHGGEYRIVGTQGTLVARFIPDPQTLTLLREGREPIGLRFDHDRVATLAGMFRRTGYVPQIDHFAAAYREGTRPLLGAREGESTLRWIAAAYHAAATGRPVAHDAPLRTDATPIAHLTA